MNKLTLGKPTESELISKIEQERAPRMYASPDFLDVKLVSISEKEAIFIVIFTTMEALNDLSKKIAGPWFADNMMSYLSGPVDRVVGEVVPHISN